MKKIPVSGPWITDKEIAYVTDAAKNAWFANANMYHERFEKAFAAYVDRSYAIALPSCTSAIHLALLAAGIGEGDNVAVPEITWIATAAPISYVGATPLFIDIDAENWCLSPHSLGGSAQQNTKAVIFVDLYGNMPDIDGILKVAKENGLFVIEDAAQAIGAQYKRKPAGSFGDVSVFSFHGSKTLTTGEGGMLVTDSADLYEKALFYRDHGRTICDKMFWNAEVAYKYKMSSMQAALGLAQLERIGELTARKREIFAVYQRELAGVDGVAVNQSGKDVYSTYWMNTVILDPKHGLLKEDVIKKLDQSGIACRPFFYPLSSLPAYGNNNGMLQSRNENAYRVSPYGVNLPSGFNLSDDDILYVCDCVKKLLRNS